MGLSEADLPQMKANISGEATSITYIHLQDVYNQIITCVGDGNLRIMIGGPSWRYAGSTNLRDNETLIASLQEAAKAGKYVAAICAAPIVLERAGLLEGRKFTCFPGVEDQIASGEHQTGLVVVDGNIVTSRGAGTALAFAYALVDLLGGDGQQLAHTMVYDRLFQ